MPRQLRIKNLKEKRGAIIQEMNAANEERNFELFNEKDAELKAIENEIKGEERLLTLETETNEANNPSTPSSGSPFIISSSKVKA